ncbi:MAG: DMT family transporter [Bacillota bacterium]|nr:DMT family transporter [Bacillota bacterium]
MATKSIEHKGVILCLLAAFCYSLGPILGKLMFAVGLPWQVVVTLRGMIPAVLLLIYALCSARYVFQIKKEHLHLFILNGLSFGFISVCNYCSLYYIDAAVATVLLYTLPVFTVLLSRIMLKEAFTAPKVIAMIMAFLGILFIIEIFNIGSLSADGGAKIFGMPSAIFGILIGLMSGLLSSLYTIFTKKLNAFYPGWTVNSWCYFMGFPIFFLIGTPHIASYSWENTALIGIIVMALVGLAAYTLYALSMQYIDAGKASLLVTLDPVLSVSMAILILGERLTIWQFLGCVLVFGGILFMEKGHLLLNFIKKKPRTIEKGNERL